MHGELKIDELLTDRGLTNRTVNAPLEAVVLIASDFLAFMASMLAGMVVFTHVPVLARLHQVLYGDANEGLLSFVLVVILAIAKFWVAGDYTRRRPFWDELRGVGRVLPMLAVFNFAIYFLTQSSQSRLPVISAWVIVALVLPTFRFIARKLLSAFGLWERPVLIIGHGQNAVDACIALRKERSMGLSVVGFGAVGPVSTGFVNVEGEAVPVYTLGDEPEILLSRLGCRSVVFAMERLDQFITPIIGRLSRQSYDVSVVPSIRGLPVFGLELQHFFSRELFLLRVRNSLGRRSAQAFKRIFDIVFTSIIIILLAPLLVWVALLIRRSGASALFRHRRIGQDGKEFFCLKFQTMVPNAEKVLADLLARDPVAREEWDKDFKLRNDPRITPIGAFLRKTSLDELPQLFNVLAGEMSLVGPRPIVRKEVVRYGDDITYYNALKPGITGLWQVSGRNDVDYASRVALDTWYARNWSLWYDLVILLKTVKVVFRRDGAY